MAYDKDEEVARFSRQLEMASDAALWTSIGKEHTEARQWEDAAQAYSEALRQKQDEGSTFRAHFGLGRALRFLGKLDEAVSSLKEAARLRPDHADTQLVLGMTCNEAGRLNEAEAALQAAARLAPNQARVHQALGMLSLQRERYQDAVHAFERAAGIDQSDAEPFAMLGLAYRALARHSEAMKALRDAVRIDPKLGVAWEALLDTCVQLRDQAGVIEVTRALGKLKTQEATAGRAVEITGAQKAGGFELAQYDEGAAYYVNIDGARRDVWWIGVSRKQPGKYVARLEAPKDIYLNLNYSPPEATSFADRVARHWLRFRWTRAMREDPNDAARQKVRTTLHYRSYLVGLPKLIERPDGSKELMDDRPMHDTPGYYCVYVADNRQGLVMLAETTIVGRSQL